MRAVEALTKNVSRWLYTEGHFCIDNGELLDGVAKIILSHGVPIERISTQVKILNPLVRSIWRVWRRDMPIEEHRPVHGGELSPGFLSSPVKHVW